MYLFCDIDILAFIFPELPSLGVPELPTAFCSYTHAFYHNIFRVMTNPDGKLMESSEICSG